MYYDDYDVVQCIQCGHIQYATTNKCLMCGGELMPADEETSNRIKEESRTRCDEAALRQINKTLDDIGKGKYHQENQYTPKCPLCQSPNIKQISVAKRAAHGYAFGLFSNTARSQWECLNCGHKF